MQISDRRNNLDTITLKNKILLSFFTLMLLTGIIGYKSYTQISPLFDIALQKQTENNQITFTTTESEFTNSLYNKVDFINMNGRMAKLLNMRGYYSDKGVYLNNEGYIVSAYPYTTTDYEYYEILAFKEFLDTNGVSLLYVNEPIKYLDDAEFTNEFGIESFSNRNADLLLNRLRDAGINAIDIREDISGEGKDIHDLFYRTDHHWTVPSGLWATQIIAKGLNESCGYDINLSIYDPQNYSFTTFENRWLGEQGNLLAETYVGLDDFTEIKPTFTTDYTFKDRYGNIYKEGTFKDFIMEDMYDPDNEEYTGASLHYSYLRMNCINNNVSHGKVLLICDSYAHATEAFLSLGVHELDSIILRDQDENFSIRNYILQNSYDTVIIAYAQSMIGAHDNPESENYSMFSLDK